MLRRDEAINLLADGSFAGSSDDQRDGFVHLSARDQLAGTLEKHFAGEANLFLVVCAVDTLGDSLIWEPSRAGRLFPHLYRSLHMTDVTLLAPIPEDWSAWTPPLPQAQ